MINNIQKDLDTVRNIVLSELKDYKADVYLFGSRANGTAGKKSDIDVAVMPKEIIPAYVFSIIREKLENSSVPYNVDLIDLSIAQKTFSEKIIKEGIKWIE